MSTALYIQSEARQDIAFYLLLHAHLREQQLRPLNVDAELHAIVDDRDDIYEAHLDDVPDAAIDVDLASLPSWLRCV